MRTKRGFVHIVFSKAWRNLPASSLLKPTIHGAPVHLGLRVREQLEALRFLETTTLAIKCIRSNNVEKVKNKISVKCFILLLTC